MIKILKNMGRLEPCKNGHKVLCVCKKKENCLEKAEKVIKDETSI